MTLKRPPALPEDVLVGINHDAFDDDLGRVLLEIYKLDADIPSVEHLIRSQVSSIHKKESLGKSVPYRLPRSRRGELILGMDEQKREVRTTLQSLCSGLLVAGSTGSGKTQLILFLLLQLATIRSVRTWAEDPYKAGLRHILPLFRRCGEETVALPARLWKWNLLQADSRDPMSHVARSADLLVRILDLPSRASSILQETIHSLYSEFGIFQGQRDHWPCLFDLFERVKSTPGLNSAAKESLLGRLGPALRLLGPGVAAYRKGWTAADLQKYSIVFENRGTSVHTRRLLMESLLYSVFENEVMHGKPNAKLSLVICLDDAQRILSDQDQTSGLSSLEELLGIIRGSGIGIAINIQSAYGVSPKLIANLNTKIIGTLASHSDWLRLGPDLGLGPDQIAFSKHDLRAGRFVAQMGSGAWRHPFILNIPKFEIPAVVTDADVEESVRLLDRLPTVRAEEFANWPGRPAEIQTREQDSTENTFAATVGPKNVSGQIPKEPTISKSAVDYLEHAAFHKFFSTTKRNEDLGIGSSKATRIRKELLDREMVEEVSINRGGRGRRFILVDLTILGREYLEKLGVKIPGNHGRGGIEHQYWCNEIFKFATDRNLECKIEDDSNSKGARVDLVVGTRKGIEIAIEVECSRGHEVQNITKDLEAGFSHVFSLIKGKERVASVREKIGLELGRDNLERVTVGELRNFESVLATHFLGMERSSDG